MGKVMYMKKGEVHTAPEKPGIELSTIAAGSIVYLNENGSPVEFYIARHNYQSSLNGDGRTLLVRKDCYDTRQWDSSGVNAYATSSIDTWLNGDYKSLLSEEVQTAIGETTFKYTVGNADSTVTTLSRSVFLVSMSELGWTGYYINNEGSTLTANSVLKATLDGEITTFWTRTPANAIQTTVYALDTDAAASSALSCSGNAGSRPCFTLPSTAKFNPDTLILKEVV